VDPDDPVETDHELPKPLDHDPPEYPKTSVKDEFELCGGYCMYENTRPLVGANTHTVDGSVTDPQLE
jgi:hypothetical protein